MMPHFITVRLNIIVQLRAACQIENDPDLVMIYIQFIAANTLDDPVPGMDFFLFYKKTFKSSNDDFLYSTLNIRGIQMKKNFLFKKVVIS